MKTSTILSIALGCVFQLAAADVVFQVFDASGNFALASPHQGDQVISADQSSPVFKNAVSAKVLNAGETVNGRQQACGCVAFASPTCSGNPRFAFSGDLTEIGTVAGGIGCYVCV